MKNVTFILLLLGFFVHSQELYYTDWKYNLGDAQKVDITLLEGNTLSGIVEINYDKESKKTYYTFQNGEKIYEDAIKQITYYDVVRDKKLRKRQQPNKVSFMYWDFDGKRVRTRVYLTGNYTFLGARYGYFGFLKKKKEYVDYQTRSSQEITIYLEEYLLSPQGELILLDDIFKKEIISYKKSSVLLVNYFNCEKLSTAFNQNKKEFDYYHKIVQYYNENCVK